MTKSRHRLDIGQDTVHGWPSGGPQIFDFLEGLKTNYYRRIIVILSTISKYQNPVTGRALLLPAAWPGIMFLAKLRILTTLLLAKCNRPLEIFWSK